MPDYTRRRILRDAAIATGALAIGVPGTATALRGKPSFTSRLYADGTTWGTKGAAIIPAPTDANAGSFDQLFAIVNGADGQLPVAEAAPGNPAYNGGRWATQTVTWTAAGIAAHDPLPVLTRYGPADDPTAIKFHHDRGHLDIVAGSPDPAATPDYFECPLLPDKS